MPQLRARETVIGKSVRDLGSLVSQVKDTSSGWGSAWDGGAWGGSVHTLSSLYSSESSGWEWETSRPWSQYHQITEGDLQEYMGTIHHDNDLAAADTDLVLFALKTHVEDQSGWGTGWQMILPFAYKVHSSRLQEVCPKLLKECDNSPTWKADGLQGVRVDIPGVVVEAILKIVYPEREVHTLLAESWGSASVVWKAALR